MEKLKQKKIKENKHTKQKKIRRNNAQLYPIYKMFSWDFICFYSVQFLFYTITKQLTASDVLIINAFFIISKIIMQIPAVTIADMLGRRKAIIIGNSLLFIYLVSLIFAPGMIGIVLAQILWALGYDIKIIAETNLLYDSVSTRGGGGLYTKLESKGASWYYWLDGIACFCSGYLFVINNYLPIYICMTFVLISVILSFKFSDVYVKEQKNKKKILDDFKEYTADLKTSVKFIVKSSRMKSYIIFGAIFYGIISIIDTYRSELLINKGVSEQQYSMIFAILVLLAGIAVTLSRKIEKKFRNRTLTFISLVYIGACFIAGFSANIFSDEISVPIIILMLIILKMCTAVWYVVEYKYLKNFTSEEMRNKIMFTYELIGGIVASVFSVIGSFILEHFEVNQSFVLVTLASFIGIVLSLDYMRTRFGLRPKQYKKSDIEF